MEDYTIYNILHTDTYKQAEYISLELVLTGSDSSFHRTRLAVKMHIETVVAAGWN